MPLLVPIYCLLTAITVVFALIHAKLLFAFYVTASALLAIAAGDELRGVITRGTAPQKLIRAILAVLILVIALWLGMHGAINLHYIMVSGTVWCLIGAVVGFFANQEYVARPRFRRRPPSR